MLFRHLPFSDRDNVPVLRKELWGPALRHEGHPMGRHFAVRIGVRLNQDWQSRRDPLPAVNHNAHASSLINVPCIEEQIGMRIAFIPPRRNSE